MYSLISYNVIFLFQFQVRAFDDGEPLYVAVANVIVNVIRNRNRPIFTLSPYFRQIHETFPVGNVVIDAFASDLDGVSFQRTLNFL